MFCAKNFFPAILALILVSCGGPFTARERKIINESSDVMYVTVLPEDKDILRTPSVDLTEEELHSQELKVLLDKMLTTVTSPAQDGVGLAAPQVGINKRVILVQRYDKEDRPFEAFVNIRVREKFGPLEKGGEGCLSVPPKYGNVARHQGIIISYVNPVNFKECIDTISGYTAVIFQHECDHLDGTLYIDKADTVYTNSRWASERAAFDYSKPSWWE